MKYNGRTFETYRKDSKLFFIKMNGRKSSNTLHASPDDANPQKITKHLQKLIDRFYEGGFGETEPDGNWIVMEYNPNDDEIVYMEYVRI